MPVSAPEPINAQHDLTRISCGKPSLDNWLRVRALSNHQKGFTAVMVVHDAGRMIGHYGLAPTAIMPTAMPRTGLLKHALDDPNGLMRARSSGGRRFASPLVQSRKPAQTMHLFTG